MIPPDRFVPERRPETHRDDADSARWPKRIVRGPSWEMSRSVSPTPTHASVEDTWLRFIGRKSPIDVRPDSEAELDPDCYAESAQQPERGTR